MTRLRCATPTGTASKRQASLLPPPRANPGRPIPPRFSRVPNEPWQDAPDSDARLPRRSHLPGGLSPLPAPRFRRPLCGPRSKPAKPRRPARIRDRSRLPRALPRPEPPPESKDERPQGPGQGRILRGTSRSNRPMSRLRGRRRPRPPRDPDPNPPLRRPRAQGAPRFLASLRRGGRGEAFRPPPRGPPATRQPRNQGSRRRGLLRLPQGPLRQRPPIPRQRLGSRARARLFPRNCPMPTPWRLRGRGLP